MVLPRPTRCHVKPRIDSLVKNVPTWTTQQGRVTNHPKNTIPTFYAVGPVQFRETASLSARLRHVRSIVRPAATRWRDRRIRYRHRREL